MWAINSFIKKEENTMKSKIITRIIFTTILSYLMVFVIDSLIGNSFLAQPELNYVVILNYILACCIVIIALIVIFGILILNKHK